MVWDLSGDNLSREGPVTLMHFGVLVDVERVKSKM